MRGRTDRTDASTSTDDMTFKNRPLCLFYFTHPFGVLSPEPPTVTVASAATAANIACTFVDMQPVPAYSSWGADASSTSHQTTTYNSDTSDSIDPAKVHYDLGDTTVYERPVQVVGVASNRIDLTLRNDSWSSSLMSGDIWLNSNPSPTCFVSNRRLIAKHKILPPLHFPVARELTATILDDSKDVWPAKWFCRERFSLPPIQLPRRRSIVGTNDRVAENTSTSDGGGCLKRRKRAKRAGLRWTLNKRFASVSRGKRLSAVRRSLTGLMRRTIAGASGKPCASSPALQEALNTIREAWNEPKSLRDRCGTFTGAPNALAESEKADRGRKEEKEMLKQVQLAELPPPRPGASPGLLRRRYSMPETIMRKYRLAQQRAESDDGGPTASPSPASMSPPRGSYNSLCEPPQHRFLRRDRELMRKSALLRRMWGRPCNAYQQCCCCSGDLYEAQNDCGRETQSLDGSRSELRHLSSSYTSSRHSYVPAGWATPKRQRLHSPHEHSNGDDMLRAAMRNSYERSEESKMERQDIGDMSDSTYQSHGPGISIYIETSTDPVYSSSQNTTTFSDVDTSAKCCIKTDSFHEVKLTNAIKKSDFESTIFLTQASENSYTDSSESFSTSIPTTKETNESKDRKISEKPTPSSGEHIDGRISERSFNIDNEEKNTVPFYSPRSIETPPYEVLEIVVSETVNTEYVTENKNQSVNKLSTPPVKMNGKKPQIDIDKYVSNILVESLNSLTDQLESMNATIGSDRKISIVEKEIKVKLQNTGVNTIVHLSPTSNNPIIFGNEELYNVDEYKDICNNIQDGHEGVSIREDMHSIESNNNLTSAGTITNTNANTVDMVNGRNDMFTNENQNDHNINKAVLQQIQKLFRDELRNEDDYATDNLPSISHIQISNVDVYIDDNTANASMDTPDTIQIRTQGKFHGSERISGVRTGNYFEDTEPPPIVPRFSAFPNTDSMEVNTSSSDDPELLGSGCTSLVDSLDDPNSPRSVLLRKSFNSNKRGELVRSAIDVLDLLPETGYRNEHLLPKEKGESFFIRIKDSDCDCEKENIVVADHMPEKIKQKLYRRQRKRELRMEYARRNKVKQLRKELDKQRTKDLYTSKRELEKDCMAIIYMLIDDVIAKIAQDEYKYLRIKQKSSTNRQNHKSEENLCRRYHKNDVAFASNTDLSKIKSSGPAYHCSDEVIDNDYPKTKRLHVHGKLSLQTRPPLKSSDCTPKRFYQKSEIHEGNKCIEILEILEYADTEQSSPDATNSDENHNHISRNKKSRIPVPVCEKIQKAPKENSHKSTRKNYLEKSSPTLFTKKNETVGSALLKSFTDSDSPETRSDVISSEPPIRRASVPQPAPRSRSNSLRFKRVFDIIPEEKSSLSLDSSNEEMNYSRTVSAPNLCNSNTDLSRPRMSRESLRTPKCTKNVGTSPMSNHDEEKRRRCGEERRARLGVLQPELQLHDEEGRVRRSVDKSVETEEKRVERKCATTQYDLNCHSKRTVRTIQSEKTEPIIVGGGGDKFRRDINDDCTKTANPKKTKHSNGKRAQFKHDSKRADVVIRKMDKQKIRMFSLEKSEEETIESVKLPEFQQKKEAVSSSDSESGGSLLCPLAPKWLSHARNKRQARRRDRPSSPPQPSSPDADRKGDQGGWSVTVAGSCRAALPADVEMRLRFPDARLDAHGQRYASSARQEYSCRHCEDCARSGVAERARMAAPSLPAPSLSPSTHTNNSRKLTLTMKKEALDSSILASKSKKKSSETLPNLESYSATRTKTRSMMKTRRGYSLHCWLPEDEPQATPSSGLSVLGCAIVPERKPRVRTMSERDLTRLSRAHPLR